MFIFGLFVGAFIGYILNALISQNITTEPQSEIIYDSNSVACQVDKNYLCIGTSPCKGNPVGYKSSMVKAN